MALYEKKSKGEGKYAAPSRGLYLRACQGASVFLVTVLALVGVLSLVLPKPTVSVYEKRELAPFPAFSAKALWSGEWMRDFEAHYADTFPGRDGFIAAAAILDDWKGIRGEDEIKIYNQPSGGRHRRLLSPSLPPPLPSRTPLREGRRPLPSRGKALLPPPRRLPRRCRTATSPRGTASWGTEG